MAHVPRDGAAARGLRRVHGIHARRAAADHRASVRRLVGLPDHRLLRADEPVRRAARSHVPHRHAAPARHRRDPRLGARALPARRTRTRLLRRHASLRARERAAWALIRSGTRSSSTTAVLEVRNFLISNALFWIDRYHIDGLRVDAVASMLYLDYARKAGEWIPNRYGGRENLEAIEFLRMLNDRVHAEYPGVPVMAEESTSWPMVTRPTSGRWARLRLQVEHGVDARHARRTCSSIRSTAAITTTRSRSASCTRTPSASSCRSRTTRWCISRSRCSGKMPGDVWQKFANLRALYGYMFGHPGKKLMFMGDEFGQWREWNHDLSLDWHLTNDPMHAGLAAMGARPQHAAIVASPRCTSATIHPTGSSGSTAATTRANVVSFVRRGADPANVVLFACNFSAVPRHDYRVGAPVSGVWTEILNSDATVYGGQRAGEPRRRGGVADADARSPVVAGPHAAAAGGGRVPGAARCPSSAHLT